jgi:heme oxygenase (mycobilin-producing)
MPNVVLINVFEAPVGRDDEFLTGWEATRDILQRQPGYVATRLHRSLDPAARFRFVNVAEWATPADFRAALAQPAMARLVAAAPFAHHPALYKVVRT